MPRRGTSSGTLQIAPLTRNRKIALDNSCRHVRIDDMCRLLGERSPGMREPKGSLTAAQYEIMDAVWNAGAEGVSVADIWQAISHARAIGRTTVLNQVDRLEKRGWLKRLPGAGP